jgi:hypothetical protein
MEQFYTIQKNSTMKNHFNTWLRKCKHAGAECLQPFQTISPFSLENRHRRGDGCCQKIISIDTAFAYKYKGNQRYENKIVHVEGYDYRNREFVQYYTASTTLSVIICIRIYNINTQEQAIQDTTMLEQ